MDTTDQLLDVPPVSVTTTTRKMSSGIKNSVGKNAAAGTELKTPPTIVSHQSSLSWGWVVGILCLIGLTTYCCYLMMKTQDIIKDEEVDDFITNELFTVPTNYKNNNNTVTSEKPENQSLSGSVTPSFTSTNLQKDRTENVEHKLMREPSIQGFDMIPYPKLTVDSISSFREFLAEGAFTSINEKYRVNADC